MVNVPLFREVHDKIAENPELHNQSDWTYGSGCDTTRCVAGWAVQLSKSNPAEADHDFLERYAREHDAVKADYYAVGRHLLGLNTRQADHLFLTAGDEEAFALVRDYAEL